MNEDKCGSWDDGVMSGGDLRCHIYCSDDSNDRNNKCQNGWQWKGYNNECYWYRVGDDSIKINVISVGADGYGGNVWQNVLQSDDDDDNSNGGIWVVNLCNMILQNLIHCIKKI